MKTLKSGLIVAVVIAFLAGAYFITAPKKNSVSDGNTSNINLSSFLSGTDNLYNFDEKNNITKALGQNLFEEIQNNNLINQDERTLASNINSLSEDLAGKVINDSMSDLELVSVIYDSDLRITKDTSKEAKNAYLKAVEDISKKNFGNFSENYLQVVVDTFQKLDPASANRLAGIYRNLADDYLELTVPADWVDIHKKIIIYAKNSEIIYQAMAGYPTDPIKGGLALEAIDSLVNNANEIQNIFGEKIKETRS
ncbi:MAG: hypothetical protein WC475_01205 [Candidatus Paceibacterota bacterium]